MLLHPAIINEHFVYQLVTMPEWYKGWLTAKVYVEYLKISEHSNI